MKKQKKNYSGLYRPPERGEIIARRRAGVQAAFTALITSAVFLSAVAAVIIGVHKNNEDIPVTASGDGRDTEYTVFLDPDYAADMNCSADELRAAFDFAHDVAASLSVRGIKTVLPREDTGDSFITPDERAEYAAGADCAVGFFVNAERVAYYSLLSDETERSRALCDCFGDARSSSETSFPKRQGVAWACVGFGDGAFGAEETAEAIAKFLTGNTNEN